MRTWLARGAIAGVIALTLGAVACSGNDDNGGSDGSDGGGGGPSITARDFEFDPSSLSVPSGETTITINNEGSTEHSFTLDDDSASVDIEAGESQTVTVNITDDAGFHCEYHPDQMTGTLTVS
jgi:plastocyanin